MREEAKLKEFALDAKFRKEWEAILDKQEKERTDRLNANHVKQTLQVRRGRKGGVLQVRGTGEADLLRLKADIRTHQADTPVAWNLTPKPCFPAGCRRQGST